MPAAKEADARGKSDARFRSQFRKTELCAFFERGWCSKTDRCEFAHGRAELQASPDLSKTSLCRKWLKSCCPRESAECQFAHGKQELRVTEAFKSGMGMSATPSSKSEPGSVRHRDEEGRRPRGGRGRTFTAGEDVTPSGASASSAAATPLSQPRLATSAPATPLALATSPFFPLVAALPVPMPVMAAPMPATPVAALREAVTPVKPKDHLQVCTDDNLAARGAALDLDACRRFLASIALQEAVHTPEAMEHRLRAAMPYEYED